MHVEQLRRAHRITPYHRDKRIHIGSKKVRRVDGGVADRAAHCLRGGAPPARPRTPPHAGQAAPSRRRPQEITQAMLVALLKLQDDAHMLRTFKTTLQGEESAVDQGGVTAEAITLALDTARGLPLLQPVLDLDDLMQLRFRPVGGTRRTRA